MGCLNVKVLCFTHTKPIRKHFQTGVEVISETVFDIDVVLVSQQHLSDTEDLANSIFLAVQPD